MTIIEPSVELIQESNPFKKIEMAGRTCYEKGTEILTIALYGHAFTHI